MNDAPRESVPFYPQSIEQSVERLFAKMEALLLTTGVVPHDGFPDGENGTFPIRFFRTTTLRDGTVLVVFHEPEEVLSGGDCPRRLVAILKEPLQFETESGPRNLAEVSIWNFVQSESLEERCDPSSQLRRQGFSIQGQDEKGVVTLPVLGFSGNSTHSMMNPEANRVRAQLIHHLTTLIMATKRGKDIFVPEEIVAVTENTKARIHGRDWDPNTDDFDLLG